jgi:hypothetical protein
MGLGLVLCGASCGVDTEGAADNFIEATEEALGQELNDDQNKCLKELLETYTDDEVIALGAREADDQLMSEFVKKQYDCIVMLGS